MGPAHVRSRVRLALWPRPSVSALRAAHAVQFSNWAPRAAHVYSAMAWSRTTGVRHPGAASNRPALGAHVRSHGVCRIIHLVGKAVALVGKAVVIKDARPLLPRVPASTLEESFGTQS